MSDKYVNGRRALLQCLDSLLAEESNIRVFRDVFQAQTDNEPMKFFRDIVMPLMPRESLGLADADAEKNAPVLTVEFKPKQG